MRLLSISGNRFDQYLGSESWLYLLFDSCVVSYVLMCKIIHRRTWRDVFEVRCAIFLVKGPTPNGVVYRP